MGLGCQDTKERKKQNIMTSGAEEVEIALNMLSIFLEKLTDHFAKYVPTLGKILIKLIHYQTNHEIRIVAAKCLPGLIDAQKRSKDP